MPGAGGFLRKHPSSETVRVEPDANRSPIASPSASSGPRRPQGIVGAMNGGPEARDMEASALGIRGRAKSAGSLHPENRIISDEEEIPDMPRIPDFSQRSIHVPMRTSSRYDQRSFPQSPSSPTSVDKSSRRDSNTSSVETYDTGATSTLPALQTKGPPDEADTLEPLLEDDPRSYNLVAPAEGAYTPYSLETRSEQLFSREHLEIIFSDPSLLLKFTSFLKTYRPRSVPILIYYLDATKALRAIQYANAVAEALDPISGHEFTSNPARATQNSVLEDKAKRAFEVLVHNDLQAYITHIYTQVVSVSISRRITGTLASHLKEASEGLAEVFVLTDPSRPDNPIVFASEEFHRTTQYGMNNVIGRNCRFLQGPKTNLDTTKRLREACETGREHCEVFLNYRRDGSPFMNLLMIAPLCDSQGRIRYFIGAQVDVSGIVKDCTDLESFRRLVAKHEGTSDEDEDHQKREQPIKRDEFQGLSEMFNMQELDTVRRWGGRMHKDTQEEEAEGNWHKPRLLLSEPSPDLSKGNPLGGRVSGKLGGVYQHYLLVRPYPSLRVLFASPSLRVPGILQSPFMNKIGGSSRVQDELIQALADGRGVTAKVRWVTRDGEEGRNRWIHCTPLLGSNSQIGVWMVVVVDEERDVPRRWRQPPPVHPEFGRKYPTQGGYGQQRGPLSGTSSQRYDSLEGDAQQQGSYSAGITPSNRSVSPQPEVRIE
ncbi:MAG: hypothetical protein M1837_003298 [Sclerophora amabilis]|nr:MAG: hypothetical protein M1837_003298 [Sclerophora amabilis]